MFMMNASTKKAKEDLRDKLMQKKNNIFCEKKLRHTIICGIPCDHDHEREDLTLIEEESKEEEESKREENKQSIDSIKEIEKDLPNFDPKL